MLYLGITLETYFLYYNIKQNHQIEIKNSSQIGFKVETL